MTEAAWSPSQLTVNRPDIWDRALRLAEATTGVTYVEKQPLPDGTIHACGGRSYPNYYQPPRDRNQYQDRSLPPSIKEQLKRQRENLNRKRGEITSILDEIDNLISQLSGGDTAPVVFIPSGAMEWLLHEVGHWVAASDKERRMINYGDGHEMEAFAFEDAVLGQASRPLVVPTQRDNCACELTGPLPQWAFSHIDKRIADDRIDIHQFRAIWLEWVAWGYRQGDDAPWRQAKSN